MARTKSRKRKLVKKSAAAVEQPPPPPPPKIEKKIKKKTKNKKKKSKIPKSGSPDSDSNIDPQTRIQTLLEPFSKDQLVTLVADLSLTHAHLFALIKSAADEDISHRKLFVHGLGWDATRQSMEPIFSAYGEIEDLHVVNDRSTCKCKGYAFLTYKNRKSAKKLLKNPKVQVGNRLVSCQLATEGPAGPGVVSQQHFPSSDYPDRKIYVNNVPASATVQRLKVFFEKFGEIESGPKGFDLTTGRFKGYAIFVYKTVEGAKKVLEEPHKMFDGVQLHCQKAAEGKGKLAGGAASITTALQPVQPQMLAQVAAAHQAQSMSYLGQQQGGIVNPFYGGGMIGNPNMGAFMGGYYGMIGGMGYGSYGFSGGGGEVGSSGAMGQGLPYMYPSGPTSSSFGKTPPANSGGYSPI